jgi:hypothetical protein
MPQVGGMFDLSTVSACPRISSGIIRAFALALVLAFTLAPYHSGARRGSGLATLLISVQPENRLSPNVFLL